MREKVLEYIDNNTEEMIDFLKEYLSYKSINTGEEGQGKEKEVQEWLAKSLESFGFEVDKWASDKEQQRPNVVATLKGTKSNTSNDLILNGHSDVVPEIEDWKYDPWEPRVENGKVFARGASDMKGPNTAGIWALKAIKESGIDIDGDVFLQLMVGEESNEGKTIGTASAIKRGYKAPFAIVMEPTDLEIHIKSCSLFFFELIVPGKSVHNSSRNQVIFPQPAGVKSGPDVGVDALRKAQPFIEMFYRMETEWNQRWEDKILGQGGKFGNDKQGIGIFTINPALIEGGNYLGAVPGKLKITYGVWYPPEIDVHDIWEEIEEKVESLAKTDDWLKNNPPTLNIPVLQKWEGFETDFDNEGIKVLRKSIEEVIDEEAIVSGFKAVCDATYLDEKDIPSVVYGPGSVNYGVHGAEEYIPIDELVKATKVYANFILNWCKEN